MKTIKTLVPVLIVLSVLASAIAMWSETLMVNVTVETGEVDVKFSSWSCSDAGPDPQAEGFHNEEGKNVATCSIDVERYDEEGDTVKLLVELNNAYPGYTVNITLEIENIGTIPVKLYSSDVSFDSPIEAVLIIPMDTQIDPGGKATYVLRITILQEAEELSEYTGEVELVFAQWNEVP